MDERAVWASALQISPNEYDEWKAVAPTEESFTFWCLNTGRISADAYFKWAKNHYGLAKLEAAYFSQDADDDLWNKIHTVANWSPWMLPIQEWDGSVYIGCVEPPVEAIWSFNVIYVLAEPTQLETLWKHFHPDSDYDENEGEISHNTGTAIDLSLMRPANSPSIPVVAEDEPPPQNPPSDNLTRMGIAPVNKVAPLELKPQRAPDEPVFEMPEGLRLDLPMNPGGSPFELLKRAISSDAPEDQGPVSNSNFSLVTDTGAHESAPPPVPDGAQPAVAQQASAPAPTVLGAAKKSGPAQPIGPLDISKAPETVDSAETEEACLGWFFRKAKTQFSTSLILTKESGKLRLWSWDSSLKPKDVSTTIGFDTPSLFRIISRTARPYHGFVVDNEIHKTFFQNLGFDILPKHVTATPIVINGAFRGLFLCIGESAPSGDALEFIERSSGRAVQQLQQIKGSFLTAA